MSSTFNIKTTPKETKSNFTNLIEWDAFSFKQYNGKIVYMNYNNPDLHIYEAYYIKNGFAHPMNYTEKGNKNIAVFSLNELNYEDVIVFWNQDSVNKYDNNKTATSNTPKLKP